MAPHPEPLLPEPGERGVASYDIAELAQRLDHAWAQFLAVVDVADLTAESRVRGRTGADICRPLASWPGHPGITHLAEQARTGPSDRRHRGPHDPDPSPPHRDADPDEIRAGLDRARQALADFLAGPDAERYALSPVGSRLGPLPLLSVLHAQAFDLAVAAADLLSCGGAPAGEALIRSGLAAVADTTGALASRLSISSAVALLTPAGGWAMASVGPDWTVAEIDAVTEGEEGSMPWPTVAGDGPDLIDAAAGRTPVPVLMMRHELRLHDLPGLLELAPIVGAVPGLPAGPLLSTLATYLGEAGRLLRLGRNAWPG